MGHVAMEGPIAWSIGDEVNGAGAADLNENGGFNLLCGFRNLTAISLGDFEVNAVKVHRMMVHGAKVGKANAHALAQFGDQRSGGGECFGIECEYIEVGHLDWIGARGAGNDLPFTEHESEVAFGPGTFEIAGMNDEKPHEAEGHLRHFIVV